MSAFTRPDLTAPACNCCGMSKPALIRDHETQPEYLCARCARSQAVYEGATDQLELRVSSAVSAAIRAWEATWQGEDFVIDTPHLMTHIMIDLAARYGVTGKPTEQAR